MGESIKLLNVCLCQIMHCQEKLNTREKNALADAHFLLIPDNQIFIVINFLCECFFDMVKCVQRLEMEGDFSQTGVLIDQAAA